MNVGEQYDSVYARNKTTFRSRHDDMHDRILQADVDYRTIT
jgi:hypothetical protein